MTPRYPKVQIVDAPNTTATVIYDLQDDDTSTGSPTPALSRTIIEDSTFELPSLELQGDPDAIGVEWGLGAFAFKQIIAGSKPAALARQVAMVKAVLRRRFWVRFQLDANTAPVWWHAYRTPPGDLSLRRVQVSNTSEPTPGDLDRWDITGTIDVDPFAYRARVTLPTTTIGNNPANDKTTPASGFFLPTISGDAPTRLRVKIEPTDSLGATSTSKWLVACIATTRPAPVMREPVGSNDLFSSNLPDAGNSDGYGGSSRAGTTASIGATPYVQGDLPGTGSARRGRYLVLARVYASIGANVTYRLLDPSGVALAAPVNVTFGSSAAQTVPVGVISIGDGIPADVPIDEAPRVRTVRLTMATVNPTDTVGIDSFTLVPVSGADVASATVLYVDINNASPGQGTPAIVDGDEEITWVSYPTVGNQNPMIACSGGYPVADPAVPNFLLVMPMRNDGTTANSATRVGATVNVTPSYHPRSAWLGSGT